MKAREFPVSRRLFRYGVLVVALAAPLGGCLEPLAFPPYTHGRSASYPGLCRLGARPGGDWASHRCEEAKYQALAHQ